MKPISSLLSIPKPGTPQSYAEKLRDARWEKKRKHIVEVAGNTCSSCRSTGVRVDVHHNFYDKNREPWEYEDHELRCLCRKCHEEFHDELLTFRRDILPYISIAAMKTLNRGLYAFTKANRGNPLYYAYALAALAVDPCLTERLALKANGGRVDA